MELLEMIINTGKEEEEGGGRNTAFHDKEQGEELFAGNDADEFSSILKRDLNPKVLITTFRFNSTRGPAFISELLSVIPNAHYYKKGTYDLQKIVEYANKKDFTSIIVVHTNRREPDPTFSSLTILDALLIIGLPYGPTAHYKLSRLVSRMDIKNHGDPTSHEPELVLTNFVACLGHRVGRLRQSLFPQDPNFHRRYIFETKENKQTDSKSKKTKDAKGETIIKRK
nr:ribosome production factor 1 [Ziziphus jujuba var. spinosa]